MDEVKYLRGRNENCLVMRRTRAHRGVANPPSTYALVPELGRKLAVLLEINAGEDPAKFGAAPAEAPALLEFAVGLPHLQVDGLMTIAPLSDDPAVARRCFDRLRALRDELAPRFGVPLRELSMGMSGDFEAAIAAGSTQVRVGTALYGTR